MNNEIILIVDDDEDLRKLLKKNLERYHFSNVLCAEDAGEAEKVIRKTPPDLILLDIMMPGIDGVTFLKRIRERDKKIPVILLTAKGEAEDKYIGFEYGADDYLVKPFLIKELVFRIKALLRRAYPDREEYVNLGNTKINLASAEVIKGDKRTHLTGMELTIFKKLYQNANRIVSTGLLCQAAVGEAWAGYQSSVQTHIRHLREKIEENPSKPKYLLTARGLGYRLVVE